MTDTVALVKSDGQRIESIRANVQPNKIFIADGNVPLEEGDVLERALPNGLTERYEILDRGYYGAFGGTAAHYQAKVQKETARKIRHSATTIYNVTGPNARVNVQSTDASTNVVSVNSAQLFEQLAEALRTGVAETSERTTLIAKVEALERVASTPGYWNAYQRFIAAAADHMTLISPFLPALAQLGR
jgi:hypothetical protein